MKEGTRIPESFWQTLRNRLETAEENDETIEHDIFESPLDDSGLFLKTTNLQNNDSSLDYFPDDSGPQTPD